MESIRTLTSQYSTRELYELAKEMIEWNGNEGVFFVTETDFFEVEENNLFLTHVKEFDSTYHVISRKKLQPYELYLLVELFEDMIDEHLMREQRGND